MSTEFLTHNKVELAFHTLRTGEGNPLLLLHGLGERSPATTPDEVATWTGPVHALDFTGHGESTMPASGGYTAEILMADADIVLAHLGAAAIVGRGVGAYIALLLAGARADRVLGAVLDDGPGLSGGPSVATSQPVFSLVEVDSTPDPYALVELGRDLRPPDYGATFARLSVESSTLDAPITVVASFRPAWLAAVVDQPGVAEATSVREALANYSTPT